MGKKICFATLSVTCALLIGAASGGAASTASKMLSCGASPAYGCWTPQPPEAGTAIPQTNVTFSLRPAADNSLAHIPISEGWFKDVGITIEPKPNGFLATNSNAIELALNGTNEVGEMFVPTLMDTLGNDKSLAMIMFTDNFLGNPILANPSLHLKSVETYVKQGMSFRAALRKTLEPLEKSGVTLTTSPLLDTRPLIDTAFKLAGLKVPSLKLVPDPEDLVLARSGREDFTDPDLAPTDIALLNDNWTSLVSIGDILSHVKGGANSPVEGLNLTIGLMANKQYADKNANTILRIASVMFRTIAAVEADKGRAGGLLAKDYPFVNRYTGSDLNTKTLWETFKEIDPLTPFTSQAQYFTNKSSASYWLTAYNAYIKADVTKKVLPAGIVPADGIWAAQVYSKLRSYQAKASTLLASLAHKNLSASHRSLVTKAKRYYRWYDFLDAYRLAKAATS